MAEADRSGGPVLIDSGPAASHPPPESHGPEVDGAGWLPYYAAMVYEFRPRSKPQTEEPSRPSLTPAERALLTAAGPTYIDAAEFGVPDSPLAAAVEPDDWRLYYLMRELSATDRVRILEFTQLLFNLRHAQRYAAGDEAGMASD